MVAASLRRREILRPLPAPSVQGCSALLAHSRTLPCKTTALGRLVQKISRSGAAALTLRVNFVPDAFGVLRRPRRSPKPQTSARKLPLNVRHVVEEVGGVSGFSSSCFHSPHPQRPQHVPKSWLSAQRGTTKNSQNRRLSTKHTRKGSRHARYDRKGTP